MGKGGIRLQALGSASDETLRYRRIRETRMSKITRRELLEIAAATAVSGAGTAASEASEQKSGIKRELYTRSPIEIYTSSLSVASGETVTLHVSTTAKRYSLQIARAGLTNKAVWAKNDLMGAFYPTPADAWEKGCRWPAAVNLKIPQDWRSGFYLISAITADQGAPETTALAFVVVRAAQPTAKILLVHATATYGAYNSYGVASLYAKRGDGASKGFFIGGERRVSFLRPWMPGFLWKPENYRFDAEFAADVGNDFDDRGINRKDGITVWANVAGFYNWDRVLIHWLEKNGYEVDYAISSDLERHPDLLRRYRLMLSVGHDEYWSWGMRDTVESFVAQGGNVCFFSGNAAFWQIRHEDSGNTVVCYKEAAEEDPLYKTDQKHLTTTLWSSPIVGRPETWLTGLSWLYGGIARWEGASPQGAGGYLVYRPEHWIFKDTGLVYADCLGQTSQIVHFEVDGCPIRMEQGLPYPQKDYEGPSSLEILGLCPAANYAFSAEVMEAGRKILGDNTAWQAFARNHGHAVLGLFTNKGTVFCAGTTDWTNGLTGKDSAVEQVTRNLLNRLSA